MKKLSSKSYLFALLAVLTTALLPLSKALAAPSGMNVSAVSKQVTYRAVGYSQVEFKWPKSGVVCRHNATAGNRTCKNLKPGEFYQIVDFHDNRKSSFRLPPVATDTFTCQAGSSGNLKNVRYGKNANSRWFITWGRGKAKSWVQLQRESPRQILTRGNNANINTRLTPNNRYRLDDLTYGGTIYINLKQFGC